MFCFFGSKLLGQLNKQLLLVQSCCSTLVGTLGLDGGGILSLVQDWTAINQHLQEEKPSMTEGNYVVVSNNFYVHPYLGK